MTLRKTTLVLTFVATTLILGVTPGVAQAPLETASTGIIQPGDEVAVRCFTHEEMHVHVQGAVLPNGAMELPGLGAVPMAGRGIQMLREELRTRYQQIYPGCTVNLSVSRPEKPKVGEGATGAAPPQTPAGGTVNPGDVLQVRCFTGEEEHANTQAIVSAQGAISLPRVGELHVAGQRLEDIQHNIAAAYRLIFPDCAVEVGRVSAAPPPPSAPEIVTPTVELTAAERFAQLPRFGLDIFAAPERPNLPTPPSEAPPEEGRPTVAQAVPPTYTLGPGDEIEVRVWTDAIEHINTVVALDAKGKVYLNLLGEVTVGGQRLAQVRDDLTRRYRRFFDRASISVALARTRVIEVRVTGDARKPGKYVLSGAATLFSALYAAGGPSDIGALRGIKLLRKGEQPLVIDLYDYLLQGDEAGDVALEPEDTIFIPPVQAMVGVSGEVRRPARYELDGPTTLAEALDLAAGLAPTGYAQNIQVWRVTDRSQRQVLDLKVPGKGVEGAGLPLQDGDLIVVQPVLENPDNVVELSGAVRRPGFYQVFEGMTISDLISAAQGLDESAHTETAALWRLNKELDYELTNFDLAAALAGDSAQNLTIRPRDRVIIYSEDRVEPPMEVEVKGAVLYPSIVAWTKGMKVSDLVRQAGGPAENAYVDRATILRIGSDQRREVLSLNLAAALAGETEADLALSRGDVLVVYDRANVAPPSQVEIAGFVENPGVFDRYQHMRVSDAILAAGGLSDRAADDVEYTPGGARGTVEPQYLKLRRTADGFEVEPDPVLGDNDHIAVLGAGDLIAKPPTVTIKGRVGRPGSYALRETAEEPDTIWKLLQRAEGLLPDANPNGIVLYRLRKAIIGDEQDEDLAHVMSMFNREMEQQTMQKAAQSSALGESITRGLARVFTSQDATAVVIPPRELTTTGWVRAVPVDGEALVSSNGQEADFPLMEGDVVVVPTLPTTVTVLGAVVRPGAVAYVPDQRPLEYLKEAGGATDDGWIQRLVIIRANGRVQPYTANLEVRPGDAILVPSKHIFRKIRTATTLERVLRLIGTFVTGYMVFK